MYHQHVQVHNFSVGDAEHVGLLLLLQQHIWSSSTTRTNHGKLLEQYYVYHVNDVQDHGSCCCSAICGITCADSYRGVRRQSSVCKLVQVSL